MADASATQNYMFKEIHEQPAVIQTGLATYLTNSQATVLPIEWLDTLENVHIIASGSSRHAGLVGQYWLEQIAGIPTRIRSGSEFQHAPFPITPNTLTIGITQSGETADTLGAIKLEQQRRTGLPAVLQSRLVGITNQPHSSLAQLVDRTLPTLAGDEIGVAATKTFTSQLLVLLCLTMQIAQHRNLLSGDRQQALLNALHQLPTQMAQLLAQEADIYKATHWFEGIAHSLVLGRGVNRAVALEGALKLKETTYIHTEGYAAGEFLHGPIALIDKNVPVIVLAPADDTISQIRANAQRIKQHGAALITIGSLTEPWLDHAIALSITDPWLSPFLTVLPLQLLAHYLAVQRGLNVDRPRHLTKTLTE
jgi:glucosamine--fructose-6-phosphate aminotransferase (isomerizing)